MTTNTGSWKNRTPDQIYEYFMDQPVDEKIAILEQMLGSPPETRLDVLHLIEDSKPELIFTDRAAVIEKLVEKFSKAFPGEYEKHFEFIERDLISYYLFRGDFESAKKRLQWPEKNPVKGVDTVTIRAFYQLLYYGHLREAIDYSKKVWRPLAESPHIWGDAHSQFCFSILVDELEKAWGRIKEGEKIDWDEFMERMEDFGNEKDVIDYEVIIEAIEKPFDRQEVLGMFENLKKRRLALFLNIQFLKFMKDRFDIPFVLSDNWWIMMFAKKLFRKRGEPGDYFYLSYKKLDRYYSDNFDYLYRINDLEMFGKAFGLKYVYHFLFENGLIAEKKYEKMKRNISALEFMLERAIYGDLWMMNFVFFWPRLNSDDPDRRAVYESTFSVSREDYEPLFNDYVSRRSEELPPKIREKIDSDFP
jgi:hypothetical protein